MKSILNPYISFNNNAREALEFYHSIFGGTIEMSTFKEGGMSDGDPIEDNKIMHGMIQAENGMTFMAADSPKGVEYKTGTNSSISLSGDNEEELTSYYNGLSAGGTIGEPLTKAPWGDTFGMFTDKFGIQWMVNIAGSKQ